MESPAYWELDESSAEMGGCCLSAALRDYARIGQFILGGARIGGQSTVPQIGFAMPRKSRWTSAAPVGDTAINGGRRRRYVQATGIFGRSLFIDPKHELVIAILGNWPAATDNNLGVARASFFRAVQNSFDKEN
jgi:CubicO group peptidase (beta-lactamase class C family)